MNKYSKHIFAAAAGLICLIIYVLTLYPAVGFMDSGELAAAAYIFGVPHPTGYPLFLAIGYIVSHLPLPGSIIYKLNLLSSIEAAAAVVITYYAALILVRYVIQKLLGAPVKKQNSKNTKRSQQTDEVLKVKKNLSDFDMLSYILAFTSAVCIGLAKTFWLDAVQVEVYALHSVFLSLIILYSLKCLISIKTPVKKNWLILFLLLGLSFSNHLTTIFVIPAILYILYLQYSSDKLFTKQILPLALFVLPGFLLYALLVISSGYAPYLNWSDLSNVSNLIEHLRGSDYSQLMFSSTSKFSNNAAEFFKSLPGEMAVISLIFSAAAMVMLWKSFRSFVIFILITVVFNLLYAFNYDIVDINTYYLLVFFLLGLIVPAGILYIITFGSPASIINKPDEPGKVMPKVVIVSLIAVIFSAAYNYKENDNSGNYANSEFTSNALNSVEANSVIMAYDWAYLYSASLYFQLAEKQRPDVRIFNIKFLAVDWYLKTISKFYPELYESIKPEAEEYLKVFGQNEKIKELKLTALVGAFINKCFEKYPLYLTIDFVLGKETKQFVENYTLKPVGLLYKVESKNSLYDPAAGANTLKYSFRKFEPDNTQKRNLHKVIPGMYFETAYYHYNNKNFEVSLKFLDKALEFDPAFRDALNLKRKISEVYK
ncbi:MAG: DUF2723 domain-containing protein [Ignavibacteria bacterium]|nr:DUF2723 domain-containing protein [Ignavibacteria bacterium]